MLLAFKSQRRRHMWGEFVIGSLLCSQRFNFLMHSGSPHSSNWKSTFPNSNSTRMAVLPPTRYLFIYLFQLFISSFCCCLSYRALVKWIAPSVVTMKCVLQTTKITVYDVFVRLDIQEHLAVSYINIWLCDKLSVTSNSVMTKNVDPVSSSVLRVLYATGR